MNYSELIRKIIKENISFTNERYELIQNNIYGFDGVLLFKTKEKNLTLLEAVKFINDLDLSDYFKETEAYKSFQDKFIEVLEFGKDNNLSFRQFFDGSAIVIKLEENEEYWYLYKDLFCSENGKSDEFAVWNCSNT